MKINSALWTNWILPALVVTITVVVPRMAALGDYPHMDDGYHAFMAQYIHHSISAGQGFPAEMSGFKLFNLLFYWVWSLPGNALVWLRMADLLFSVIAAWLFCILMGRESGNKIFGLVLALPFLAGLNLPGAIDSGYKNSFSPAFACLFAACIIVEAAGPKSGRWIWSGILCACGVLFRETFFFFPLLACISLIWIRNFDALWRFALGGIIGALAIFLLSALVRGQFLEIFNFYLAYGKIYGPEEIRRMHKFFSNGTKAVTVYWPLLTLLALAVWAAISNRTRWRSGRALFWIAATVLPLLEPLSKIGFLYHFSVCLPGMAGYCAWAYSRIAQNRREARAAVFLAAIAFCCMAPLLAGHLEKAPVTMATIGAYPAPGWPDELAHSSTTLEAAKKIRALLPENGRASSSGFAYFVFPASQTLPPALGLGDLSRTFIYSGYNPEKFKKQFDQNPPDLVLVGRAIGDHSAIFGPELREILDSDPNYELVDTVEQNLRKNYGWLGYDIYKRRQQ